MASSPRPPKSASKAKKPRGAAKATGKTKATSKTKAEGQGKRPSFEEAAEKTATADQKKKNARRPRDTQAEAELAKNLSKKQQPRVRDALDHAARAYSRGRYGEATQSARKAVRLAPDVHAAREILGLSLYKQGKWTPALVELQKFSDETGSYDQYPVMADCYRGLGNTAKVRECWNELRRSGPAPEVMAEGRIVMASALADDGDLQAAFQLLERNVKSLRAPKEYHLRQWYVFADILERMGELGRARRMFERIAQHDRDFADVQARIKSIR